LRWISRRKASEEQTITTLHLICGLPCSGKTTLARELEVKLPALRLSPDEWIVWLCGPDIAGEALDAARDPMEETLWELSARVLSLGIDVILEYGFWSRSEREDYRRRAAHLGARSELHFTHASEQELLRRLAIRNADPPAGSFRIEQERLVEWISVFEAPDEEELEPREASGGG
jgi:predicted kinase